MLTQAIWELRQARGDRATNPEFIRTIPKHGYPLIAAIKPNEKSERREPIVILHVEDDPAHAELARRGFADCRIDFKIQNAETGEQALDYLFRRGQFTDAKSSPRPDVVLLDLRLPGIDGLEVLGEIRSSPKLEDLPVILLTTSEADRGRLLDHDQRLDAFLDKPLNFDGFVVLLDVISMVFAKIPEALPD